MILSPTLVLGILCFSVVIAQEEENRRFGFFSSQPQRCKPNHRKKFRTAILQVEVPKMVFETKKVSSYVTKTITFQPTKSKEVSIAYNDVYRTHTQVTFSTVYQTTKKPFSVTITYPIPKYETITNLVTKYHTTTVERSDCGKSNSNQYRVITAFQDQYSIVNEPFTKFLVNTVTLIDTNMVFITKCPSGGFMSDEEDHSFEDHNLFHGS